MTLFPFTCIFYMPLFFFRSKQEPLFFECDMMDREAIQQMCQGIQKKIPEGVDILVNNAGIWYTFLFYITFQLTFGIFRIRFCNAFIFSLLFGGMGGGGFACLIKVCYLCLFMQCIFSNQQFLSPSIFYQTLLFNITIE